MLATLFRKTSKQIFGGGSQPRPARREPGRARLGVEALEAREVLSGNTAGYVLSGGNLFQQTASGLVPRDTGVRDFTAPGGVLYDLHTDGGVFRFSNGTPTPIGATASALVSDVNRSVFALHWD